MTPAKGRIIYSNGKETEFEVSSEKRVMQIDPTLAIEHGPSDDSSVDIRQNGDSKIR